MGVSFSSILFYIGPPSTPIDFYEQANHIRRPQTNFTVSPRPSNSILPIFKGSSTKRMGNLSLAEKADCKSEQECRLPYKVGIELQL
jgi:hypothetical protein